MSAKRPEITSPPAVANTTQSEGGDPWLGRRVHAATLRAYVPVMRLLVAQPSLSAAEACRRCGLTKPTSDNTFSHWRGALFGDGAVSADTLARFTEWANEQLVRRREPKLPDGDPAPEQGTTVKAPDDEMAVQPTIKSHGYVGTVKFGIDNVAKETTPTRHSARNHDGLVEALLAAAQACNQAALALLRTA